MSWLARLPPSVTVDRVGVAAAIAGCVGLVAEAQRQGKAPMNGSLPAKDGTAAGRVFTSKQCRQLEQDGYIVLDNFLSKQQVQEARNAIQTLDDNYQFRSSPYETFDGKAASSRTRDRVIINRSGNLDMVRMQISAFARSLVDSDFKGFPRDDYDSTSLHVPSQMQVSICGGLETPNPDEEESTHNFYHKHVDSAGAHNFFELGVIGWIRSQHLRQRYLTCLVYLNTDWKEGDGGCLRVFPNGESEDSYVDIAPLGGRMVVLSSPSLFHGVLPTNAQRYACAAWLALA
ncbi:unnamed protein product [Cylindrotheca closterium]|uniref:Fe2OG dioxygenase domain-containing protein n=1 Tax=Cylindrotheca closterium TaxID=2856 RepID=A0AAD2PW53_9STRA|nr:unnamed protein product [Cylindrotheca closterium]